MSYGPMQDYQGNGSFSRYLVAYMVGAAVLSIWATILFPTCTTLVHAFDILLATSVTIYFGGKAPEVIAVVKAPKEPQIPPPEATP